MKKLDRQQLLDLVSVVKYMRDGLLTVAIVELQSGFKLVGKSACMNEEYFCKETGKEVAFNDALNQVWQLEGYHRMAVEAKL
jgi:hypothetical protein